MTLKNDYTGDLVEVPPPDSLGASVVRFNGRVVETVLYSDLDGGSVTTGDGRVFRVEQWTAYIIEQIITGAWA